MTDPRKLLIDLRADYVDAIQSASHAQVIAKSEPDRQMAKIRADNAKQRLSRIDAALSEKVEPVAYADPIATDFYNNPWLRVIEGKRIPPGTKLYAAPADQDRVDAERLDWMEKNVSAIRDIGWINGPIRDAIDRARSAK